MRIAQEDSTNQVTTFVQQKLKTRVVGIRAIQNIVEQKIDHVEEKVDQIRERIDHFKEKFEDRIRTLKWV